MKVSENLSWIIFCLISLKMQIATDEGDYLHYKPADRTHFKQDQDSVTQ